ncbi:hypothetical protein NP493_179g03020 [Ridgeia piscesae]|uniref:Uncharacterized protein n=1 Tax=Ridgeia piscesae TaxID=27915 RepID=A0AAD9P2U9_RIDPI|nr:hypothetical protein NP493_179g03020 [Ridgeia piscesae]
MSRYGTKTYSRSNQRESFASKAFDDVFGKDTKLSTAKAASTIQRWGKASFTSTRGSQVHDNDTRKRRNPDPPAEEEDMFCSDIFSFDSDDDGPKNPKRGMGYKIAEKPNNDNGPGVKSLKRANNDKTHATKPKKTNSTVSTSNSNSVHKTVASDPRKTASKQMSMDAFVSSNHTKLNVRHATSLRSSQPKSLQHDKPMKKTKKKFFRSSLNSSNESITDHNYSHTEDSTDDGLTQPSEDDEDKIVNKDTFESDDLEDLESGDPEIIFNSPKKRSAEKKKNAELQLSKAPVASSSENDTVHVNDSDSVCSSQSMSPATTRRLRVKIISGPGSDSGSDGSIRLERSNRGRLGLLDRTRDKSRKKGGEPIVRRLLTSPKKAYSWGYLTPLAHVIDLFLECSCVHWLNQF